MKYKSCLNCKDRYLGCHTNCEDYKLFKQHITLIKQNENEYHKQTAHIKNRRRYKNG